MSAGKRTATAEMETQRAGNEPVFSREQLIASQKFHDRRDALLAVLSGDGKYSVQEAEKKMEHFMKGKVK